MIIDLRLLPPHPKQAQILGEAKRFNVLKCGRRFGKTSLTEELIADKILDGVPVAYYAPTYKDLYNVWSRIKNILQPILLSKDETVKQLKVISGGTLDMWSMEDPDSGRGRKYARVIIDEAEKARHLEQAWKATIRATLADYKGDCWFLSTPRFGSTYFKKLAKMEGDDWASWTFTTYDNPYIDAAEIDNAREQLDEATFRCEFLAEDVTLAVNKFIYNFDRNKHVVKGLQLIPHLPVILSFDMNVEPITCLVGQCDGIDHVRILEEYRLMNSDIEELCNRILADYPDKMLLVTGDASGQNRTALKRDLNYYKEIKRVLKLGMGQFKLAASNPPIKNTRVLCNSLLGRHKDYLFSDRVPYLITDIEEVEVDEHGGLDKSKDKHQSHLLDCFVGETIIKTINGNIRIDKIKINEKVLTRCGYKKIIDKWSSLAEVYEFEFSNGEKIQCTKNHKFFIHNIGFIEIFNIFERKISLWKFFTTIDDTQTNMQRNTFQPVEVKNTDIEDCISKNGLIILERYQQGSLYIIKTITDLITNWITLLLSVEVNMLNCTWLNGLKKILHGLKKECRKHGKKQLYGMVALPVLNGIKNMQKSVHLEQEVMELEVASFAVKNLKLKNLLPSSAQIIVNQHGDENIIQIQKYRYVKNAVVNLQHSNIHRESSVENALSLQVKIISCKYIGIKEVWDITVEDSHEFVANGFLVHNCWRYFNWTFLNKFLDFKIYENKEVNYERD